MGHSRLSSIRERLRREGFSDGVYRLILARYKHQDDDRSTLGGHQKVWENFIQFCGSPDKALDFKLPDIANFLSDMFDKGARGDRVSAAISTLELTRGFFQPESTRLADHPIIEKLRKAARIQRPPPKEVKLEGYYDPYRILRSLAKQRTNRWHVRSFVKRRLPWSA